MNATKKINIFEKCQQFNSNQINSIIVCTMVKNI